MSFNPILASEATRWRYAKALAAQVKKHSKAASRVPVPEILKAFSEILKTDDGTKQTFFNNLHKEAPGFWVSPENARRRVSELLNPIFSSDELKNLDADGVRKKLNQSRFATGVDEFEIALERPKGQASSDYDTNFDKWRDDYLNKQFPDIRANRAEEFVKNINQKTPGLQNVNPASGVLELEDILTRESVEVKNAVLTGFSKAGYYGGWEPSKIEFDLRKNLGLIPPVVSSLVDIIRPGVETSEEKEKRESKKKAEAQATQLEKKTKVDPINPDPQSQVWNRLLKSTTDPIKRNQEILEQTMGGLLSIQSLVNQQMKLPVTKDVDFVKSANEGLSRIIEERELLPAGQTIDPSSVTLMRTGLVERFPNYPWIPKVVEKTTAPTSLEDKNDILRIKSRAEALKWTRDVTQPSVKELEAGAIPQVGIDPKEKKILEGFISQADAVVKERLRTNVRPIFKPSIESAKDEMFAQAFKDVSATYFAQKEIPKISEYLRKKVTQIPDPNLQARTLGVLDRFDALPTDTKLDVLKTIGYGADTEARLSKSLDAIIKQEGDIKALDTEIQTAHADYYKGIQEYQRYIKDGRISFVKDGGVDKVKIDPELTTFYTKLVEAAKRHDTDPKVTNINFRIDELNKLKDQYRTVESEVYKQPNQISEVNSLLQKFNLNDIERLEKAVAIQERVNSRVKETLRKQAWDIRKSIEGEHGFLIEAIKQGVTGAVLDDPVRAASGAKELAEAAAVSNIRDFSEEILFALEEGDSPKNALTKGIVKAFGQKLLPFIGQFVSMGQESAIYQASKLLEEKGEGALTQKQKDMLVLLGSKGEYDRYTNTSTMQRILHEGAQGALAMVPYMVEFGATAGLASGAVRAIGRGAGKLAEKVGLGRVVNALRVPERGIEGAQLLRAGEPVETVIKGTYAFPKAGSAEGLTLKVGERVLPTTPLPGEPSILQIHNLRTTGQVAADLGRKALRGVVEAGVQLPLAMPFKTISAFLGETERRAPQVQLSLETPLPSEQGYGKITGITAIPVTETEQASFWKSMIGNYMELLTERVGGAVMDGVATALGKRITKDMLGNPLLIAKEVGTELDNALGLRGLGSFLPTMFKNIAWQTKMSEVMKFHGFSGELSEEVINLLGNIVTESAGQPPEVWEENIKKYLSVEQLGILALSIGAFSFAMGLPRGIKMATQQGQSARDVVNFEKRKFYFNQEQNEVAIRTAWANKGLVDQNYQIELTPEGVVVPMRSTETGLSVIPGFESKVDVLEDVKDTRFPNIVSYEREGQTFIAPKGTTWTLSKEGVDNILSELTGTEAEITKAKFEILDSLPERQTPNDIIDFVYADIKSQNPEWKGDEFLERTDEEARREKLRVIAEAETETLQEAKVQRLSAIDKARRQKKKIPAPQAVSFIDDLIALDRKQRETFGNSEEVRERIQQAYDLAHSVKLDLNSEADIKNAGLSEGERKDLTKAYNEIRTMVSSFKDLFPEDFWKSAEGQKVNDVFNNITVRTNVNDNGTFDPSDLSIVLGVNPMYKKFQIERGNLYDTEGRQYTVFHEIMHGVFQTVAPEFEAELSELIMTKSGLFKKLVGERFAKNFDTYANKNWYGKGFYNETLGDIEKKLMLRLTTGMQRGMPEEVQQSLENEIQFIKNRIAIDGADTRTTMVGTYEKEAIVELFTKYFAPYAKYMTNSNQLAAKLFDSKDAQKAASKIFYMTSTLGKKLFGLLKDRETTQLVENFFKLGFANPEKLENEAQNPTVSTSRKKAIQKVQGFLDKYKEAKSIFETEELATESIPVAPVVTPIIPEEVTPREALDALQKLAREDDFDAFDEEKVDALVRIAQKEFSNALGNGMAAQLEGNPNNLVALRVLGSGLLSHRVITGEHVGYDKRYRRVLERFRPPTEEPLTREAQIKEFIGLLPESIHLPKEDMDLNEVVDVEGLDFKNTDDITYQELVNQPGMKLKKGILTKVRVKGQDYSEFIPKKGQPPIATVVYDGKRYYLAGQEGKLNTKSWMFLLTEDPEGKGKKKKVAPLTVMNTVVPVLTPEQREINNKRAKKFGFTSPTHAINTIKKQGGKEYKVFADIPDLELIQAKEKKDAPLKSAQDVEIIGSNGSTQIRTMNFPITVESQTGGELLIIQTPEVASSYLSMLGSLPFKIVGEKIILPEGVGRLFQIKARGDESTLFITSGKQMERGGKTLIQGHYYPDNAEDIGASRLEFWPKDQIREIQGTEAERPLLRTLREHFRREQLFTPLKSAPGIEETIKNIVESKGFVFRGITHVTKEDSDFPKYMIYYEPVGEGVTTYVSNIPEDKINDEEYISKVLDEKIRDIRTVIPEAQILRSVKDVVLTDATNDPEIQKIENKIASESLFATQYEKSEDSILLFNSYNRAIERTNIKDAESLIGKENTDAILLDDDPKRKPLPVPVGLGYVQRSSEINLDYPVMFYTGKSGTKYYIHTIHQTEKNIPIVIAKDMNGKSIGRVDIYNEGEYYRNLQYRGGLPDKGQLSSTNKRLEDWRGDDYYAASNVDVNESHQRDGVASAMYRYAQNIGFDLRPSRRQTEFGKALWGGEERLSKPFGLSEIPEPVELFLKSATVPIQEFRTLKSAIGEVRRLNITDPYETRFAFAVQNEFDLHKATRESLKAYADEKLSTLLGQITDRNRPDTKFTLTFDDSNLDELGGHPDFRHFVSAYQQDPETWKQRIIDKSNELKEDKFREWQAYLETNPDPFFIVPILDNVFEKIGNETWYAPVSADFRALNQLKDQYQESKDFTSNSGKDYLNLLKELSRKDSEIVRVDKAGKVGEWILIQGKNQDPDNFKQNVAYTEALSRGTGWCLFTGSAPQYLEQGDIWMYLVSGQGQVAISFYGRAEDGQVDQIQGHQNKPPYDYIDETLEFIEKKNYKGGNLEDRITQLKRAKELSIKRKSYTKPEDWLDELGVKYSGNEKDGFVIHGDFSGWELEDGFKVDKIKEITGTANLNHLTGDLPYLIAVGDAYADIWDGNAPNLQTVGGIQVTPGVLHNDYEWAYQGAEFDGLSVLDNIAATTNDQEVIHQLLLRGSTYLLAYNPFLSPESQLSIFENAINLGHPGVIDGLLANPSLIPEIQRRVTTLSLDFSGLARNPAIIPEVQLKLIEEQGLTDYLVVWMGLASNNSITPEAQWKLLNTSYPEIIFNLAGNPALTPEFQFEMLAKIENIGSLRGVYENLRHDAFVNLSGNPSITPETQLALLDIGYSDLKRNLAANPSIIPEIQLRLSVEGDSYTLIPLARNPSITPEVQRRLLRMVYAWSPYGQEFGTDLGASLLANPSFTIENRIRLYLDPKEFKFISFGSGKDMGIEGNLLVFEDKEGSGRAIEIPEGASAEEIKGLIDDKAKEIDANRIIEAADFAKIAHGEQKRKYTGDPYIIHTEDVARRVYEYTKDTDLAVAALLHDVVEDTPTTIDEIESRFGPKISGIVSELTDEFTNEKYPDLNREQRKLREHERLGGISSNAKIIKMFDIENNAESILPRDPNFGKVYLREANHLLDSIQDADPTLAETVRTNIQSGVEHPSRSILEVFPGIEKNNLTGDEFNRILFSALEDILNSGQFKLKIHEERIITNTDPSEQARQQKERLLKKLLKDPKIQEFTGLRVEGDKIYDSSRRIYVLLPQADSGRSGEEEYFPKYPDEGLIEGRNSRSVAPRNAYISGEDQPNLAPSQRDAVNIGFGRFVDGHKSYHIFDGPGVGKTRENLALMELTKKKVSKSGLFVIPSETLLPQIFKDAVALGIDVQFIRKFSEMDFNPNTTYVITYPALVADSAAFRKRGDLYAVVTFDEAQGVKNEGSYRAELSDALADNAEHIIFSTATPGDKIEHYEIMSRFWPKDLQVMYHKAVDLNKKADSTGQIKGELIRVQANDVMQKIVESLINKGLAVQRRYSFKNLTYHKIDLPMPKELQEINDNYEKVRADKSENYITISSNMRAATEALKVDAIMDMIQKSSEKSTLVLFERAHAPVSIYGHSFKSGLDRLTEKLKAAGIPFGIVTGDVVKTKKTVSGIEDKRYKTRANAIADFQSGKIKVLIGTGQSMGTGLDLDDQVGDQPRNLIIATLPRAATEFWQYLGRIDRRTTQSKGDVYALFMPTLEEQENYTRLWKKSLFLEGTLGMGTLFSKGDVEPILTKDRIVFPSFPELITELPKDDRILLRKLYSVIDKIPEVEEWYNKNFARSLEEIKTDYIKQFGMTPDAAKASIEKWREENNIVYDPKEAYDRGEKFYHGLNAYSHGWDVDRFLDVLVEAYMKGEDFVVSAYTRPPDGQRLGDIQIEITPQSGDILWAAKGDVYSGVEGGEMGLTRKYPRITSLGLVSGSVSGVIDGRWLNHSNELGIRITPFNISISSTEPSDVVGGHFDITDDGHDWVMRVYKDVPVDIDFHGNPEFDLKTEEYFPKEDYPDVSDVHAELETRGRSLHDRVTNLKTDILSRSQTIVDSIRGNASILDLVSEKSLTKLGINKKRIELLHMGGWIEDEDNKLHIEGKVVSDFGIEKFFERYHGEEIRISGRLVIEHGKIVIENTPVIDDLVIRGGDVTFKGKPPVFHRLSVYNGTVRMDRIGGNDMHIHGGKFPTLKEISGFFIDISDLDHNLDMPELNQIRAINGVVMNYVTLPSLYQISGAFGRVGAVLPNLTILNGVNIKGSPIVKLDRDKATMYSRPDFIVVNGNILPREEDQLAWKDRYGIDPEILIDVLGELPELDDLIENKDLYSASISDYIQNTENLPQKDEVIRKANITRESLNSLSPPTEEQISEMMIADIAVPASVTGQVLGFPDNERKITIQSKEGTNEVHVSLGYNLSLPEGYTQKKIGNEWAVYDLEGKIVPESKATLKLTSVENAVSFLIASGKHSAKEVTVNGAEFSDFALKYGLGISEALDFLEGVAYQPNNPAHFQNLLARVPEEVKARISDWEVSVEKIEPILTRTILNSRVDLPNDFTEKNLSFEIVNGNTGQVIHDFKIKLFNRLVYGDLPPRFKPVGDAGRWSVLDIETNTIVPGSVSGSKQESKMLAGQTLVISGAWKPDIGVDVGSEYADIGERVIDQDLMWYNLGEDLERGAIVDEILEHYFKSEMGEIKNLSRQISIKTDEIQSGKDRTVKNLMDRGDLEDRRKDVEAEPAKFLRDIVDHLLQVWGGVDDPGFLSKLPENVRNVITSENWQIRVFEDVAKQGYEKYGLPTKVRLNSRVDVPNNFIEKKFEVEIINSETGQQLHSLNVSLFNALLSGRILPDGFTIQEDDPLFVSDPKVRVIDPNGTIVPGSESEFEEEAVRQAANYLVYSGKVRPVVIPLVNRGDLLDIVYPYVDDVYSEESQNIIPQINNYLGLIITSENPNDSSILQEFISKIPETIANKILAENWGVFVYSDSSQPPFVKPSLNSKVDQDILLDGSIPTFPLIENKQLLYPRDSSMDGIVEDILKDTREVSKDGINWVMNLMENELRENGGFNLRGRIVNNPEEFGIMAKVYNDPRMETVRFFLLRNNQIVDHFGVTSKLPTSSAVWVGKIEIDDILESDALNKEKLISARRAQKATEYIIGLQERMNQVGADEYIVLHNHPVGTATLGEHDVNFVTELSEAFPGKMKYSVIISPTEYSIWRPWSDSLYFPKEDQTGKVGVFHKIDGWVQTGLTTLQAEKESARLNGNVFPLPDVEKQEIIGSLVNKIEDFLSIKPKEPTDMVVFGVSAQKRHLGTMEIAREHMTNGLINSDLEMFIQNTGSAYVFLTNIPNYEDEDLNTDVINVLSDLAFNGLIHNASFENGQIISDNFIPEIKQEPVGYPVYFSKADTDHEKWRKEILAQANKVKEIRDDQGFLLAPNGKRSNLNKWQWKVVRTPMFKEWFGDWEKDPEKASKVIDENGEPKVVYHGTGSDIETFDLSKIGQKGGLSHTGFGFAADPKFSTRLAEWPGGNPWGDSAPNIIPVFLNIRNPYFYAHGGEALSHAEEVSQGVVFPARPWGGRFSPYQDEMEFLRAQLQGWGYDGIAIENDWIYFDELKDYGAFFAFNANQVKSAIAGTYRNTNSILNSSVDYHFPSYLRGDYVIDLHNAFARGLTPEEALDFVAPDYKDMTESERDILFKTIQNQLFKAGFANIKQVQLAVQIEQVEELRNIDGKLLAPNLEPTNLTEYQWKVVRTPIFKEWFGDWEKDPESASKVIDENGEPLVVYHGTVSDFDAFDPEKFGKATGARFVDKNGFFFTNNPNVASSFARILPNIYGIISKGGNVLPIFLNFRNPQIMDAEGEDADLVTFPEADEFIIDNIVDSYGGVVLKPSNVYFTINSENAKSAIASTFTTGEGSILKSASGITFDSVLNNAHLILGTTRYDMQHHKAKYKRSSMFFNKGVTYFDSMLALKRMQRLISEERKDLRDQVTTALRKSSQYGPKYALAEVLDAYLVNELHHTLLHDDLKKLEKWLFDTLGPVVKKNNLTEQMFHWFMYVHHAPERNYVILNRNDKFGKPIYQMNPDGTYATMNGEFIIRGRVPHEKFPEGQGSGLTNRDAIDGFELEGKHIPGLKDYYNTLTVTVKDIDTQVTENRTVMSYDALALTPHQVIIGVVGNNITEEASKIKEAADIVWKKLQENRDMMLQHGDITKELKDILEAQFEYYMPLMDLDMDEDAVGFGGGAVIRTATGRESLVDESLAFIIAKLQATYKRIRQNEMPKTVAKFLMAMSTSEEKTPELLKKLEEGTIDFNLTDLIPVKDIKGKIRGYESATRYTKEVEGQKGKYVDAPLFTIDVAPGRPVVNKNGMVEWKSRSVVKLDPERTIKFKHLGETHFIHLNYIPLARAINHFKGMSVQEYTDPFNIKGEGHGGFWGWFFDLPKRYRQGFRFFGQLVTALSPYFLMYNGQRDGLTAAINAFHEHRTIPDAEWEQMIKDGYVAEGTPKPTGLSSSQIWTDIGMDVGGAVKGIFGPMTPYAALFSKAGRAVKHYIRQEEGKPLGKLSAEDQKYLDYINDMREDGGFIEFYSLKDHVDIQKLIKQSLIEDPTATKVTKGVASPVNAIFDLMRHGNQVVETATRLATYVAAREGGYSRKRAASLSKNITVDFTRKGLGGTRPYDFAKNWYLFFNANLQGMSRFYEVLARNGLMKGFFQRMLPYIAMGMGMAQMARIMGGEDDDGRDKWDHIDETQKKRNLFVYLKDGLLYPIKLPFGFNIPFYIGTAMEAVFQYTRTDGKKGIPPDQAFYNILGVVMDFVDVPGANLDAGDPFGALIPSPIRPMYHLSLNKSWTGASIYPQFAEHKPNVYNTYGNAGTISNWLAEKWYEAPFLPGSISPDWITYTANAFGGGLTRTVVEAVNYAIEAGGDKYDFKTFEGFMQSASQSPILKSILNKPRDRFTFDLLYANQEEFARFKEQEKQGEFKGVDRRILSKIEGERLWINGKIKDIQDDMKTIKELRTSATFAEIEKAYKELRLKMIEVNNGVEAFKKANPFPKGKEGSLFR